MLAFLVASLSELLVGVYMTSTPLSLYHRTFKSFCCAWYLALQRVVIEYRTGRTYLLFFPDSSCYSPGRGDGF
ncbi:hypothetical protein B0H14DRAFT_2708910 [Mycena olivaceomarginata]|nr:hypothetical protein B0H14DRAFT_2708910 [Mycena olivaceomarginata]